MYSSEKLNKSFLFSYSLFTKCYISGSPKCFEWIRNFDGHKGLLLSLTMFDVGLEPTNSLLLLVCF